MYEIVTDDQVLDQIARLPIVALVGYAEALRSSRRSLLSHRMSSTAALLGLLQLLTIAELMGDRFRGGRSIG